MNFKNETIDMISESTWWKRRSKLEKGLLALSLVALLIIVSLVIALNSGKKQICSTKECIQLSNNLLNSMDLKSDPCEDFYQFVCGNLMKNINANKVDVISVYKANAFKVREQIRCIVERPIELREPKHLIAAKNFYRACMNETAIEAEGLKRLKGILRDLGGWPLLDGNKWREANFDWKLSIHKLRKIGYDFDLLLPITVDLDVRTGSRFAIYVDYPNIKYHQEKLKPNYFSYMMDMAVMMGLHTFHEQNELKEVYNFEISLLKILPADTYFTKDYTKFTVAELQEKFPSFAWYQYINGVLYPSAKISIAEEVIVKNTEYVEKLENLLDATSARVLANFIAWNVVHRFAFFLNDEAENIIQRHKMWNSESAIGITNSKWENCVNIVGTRLRWPILNAYLDEYTTNKSQDYIKDMVNIIKIQYRNTIKSTDWMDDETREFSLGKLSQMKIHIGAPDKLYDDDLLSDIYDPVEIHEDKYLASVLNIDFLNTNLVYEKLHHQVEGYIWWEQVLPFNEYVKYIPERNILLINSPYMETGILERDAPYFFNYASVGTLIAKEMGKLLTDGLFFNEVGLFQQWQSEEYYSRYLTKENCLHKAYRGNITHHYVDVKLPEYPVLSDYYGIHTTYSAYRTWTTLHNRENPLTGLVYAPNELFWILYAFGSCSSRQTNETFYPNIDERRLVNGPLSNMVQFSEEFMCPRNSKMDTADKCFL